VCSTGAGKCPLWNESFRVQSMIRTQRGQWLQMSFLKLRRRPESEGTPPGTAPTEETFRHYRDFTSIFTFLTTSAFGKVSSRMPFFKVAFTLSGFTSIGNLMVL